MHYGAMLVGQFLKAAEMGTGDIPAQPTYTIMNVALEKLESVNEDGGAGKTKTKGIVYFREIDRGWVINRTNAECLAGMFGIETNDWIGKRVTLFPASVRVGPKMDLGIRVKGSPDIDRPVSVSVKLPRRKPIPMTMEPTGTPVARATVEAGREAAVNGSAALGAWWKAIGADGRVKVADAMAYTGTGCPPALKTAAETADRAAA